MTASRWRVAARAVGWLVVLATGLEGLARQLARTAIVPGAPEAPILLAAVPVAGLALIIVAGRRAARRRSTTAAVLAAAFSLGLALQIAAGARLQSDGFYYYAYLRSLAFDGDVNFDNDYRLLGLDDKPHLFEPTVTGHAQSAWTIGPAIAWAPFFVAGHVVATGLAETRGGVATDGTSFPYRQAVCVAGLAYLLLGAWCCVRLAGRFVARPTAATATALTIGGSFMLWYGVVEPSMTHAPSMAAVTGFTWYWVATLHRRRLAGWAVLGGLAGLATLLRWQNALFALLPAIELGTLAVGHWRAGRRDALGPLLAGGAAFTLAASVAFGPQLVAWKAIYGTYLAVSPIGPEIRWDDSHVLDALFSSRNGLLAMSPILYVGAVGLVAFAVRRPAIGVPMLAASAAMTYFNGAIADWWGSDAFGGRRFDGLVPFFVLGTVAVLDTLRRTLARRPELAVAAVLAALVLWNVSLMAVARRGAFTPGEAVSFRSAGAAQARVVHAWFGHPFSYPLNLRFALRNGVSPGAWDLYGPLRFLGDARQPYGRIDVGGDDGLYIGDGWHEREGSSGETFRWAGRDAEVIVPLDHRAPLELEVRARAFPATTAPVTLVLETPYGRHGPVPLPAEWTTLTFQTTAGDWRAGLNRVRLRFSTAARPVDVGQGDDTRELAAAVDGLRLQVRKGGRP